MTDEIDVIPIYSIKMYLRERERERERGGERERERERALFS